ncbi:hypothetical protein [Flavihumibacter petaseus]|uniref:Uncharacterized protein n=1 Tax=Flavihumibacter petaseus NBRC 106054 TaxID=1220578 RepID=A0A0E9N0P5_9BACT|nr:hypothetical protein [Flavihumibacter petaseus]GAO43216.1 hypothetical protein FPE01S_02_03200 [Flavihumibacter petaseus NBRC 106054]
MKRFKINNIMNFELAEDISELLSTNKLDDAILLAETKLKEQVSTDFNKLLGQDLLHQTDKLVDFFSDFCESVISNLDLKAIYAEMNGFTINCDLWFLDLFAYDKVGGTDDTDWLADWEEGNSTTNSFPLTGYEELQKTYQDYMDNQKYKDSQIQAASDVAELLIVLRLQELVRAATEVAKNKNLFWATIPVFASAHDYYDTVYKAN